MPTHRFKMISELEVAINILRLKVSNMSSKRRDINFLKKRLNDRGGFKSFPSPQLNSFAIANMLYSY